MKFGKKRFLHQTGLSSHSGIELNETIFSERYFKGDFGVDVAIPFDISIVLPENN